MPVAGVAPVAWVNISGADINATSKAGSVVEATVSSNVWVDTIVSVDGVSTTVEVVNAIILVKADVIVSTVKDFKRFNGTAMDGFAVGVSFSWCFVEIVITSVKDSSTSVSIVRSSIR